MGYPRIKVEPPFTRSYLKELLKLIFREIDGTVWPEIDRKKSDFQIFDSVKTSPSLVRRGSKLAW